jgi:hypothetical protein
VDFGEFRKPTLRIFVVEEHIVATETSGFGIFVPSDKKLKIEQ